MNMLQKCAILGLVFLLAGGAAYAWLHGEAQEERRQAQSFASADSLEPDDHLEKYGRWYRLSPEQQNQLLLEIDIERKSKTVAQLEQEQQTRLRADLDKLAAGQMNPGDIADFLYGRGWASQVEEYKLRREQMETAQTIAVVCLSIGGILLGGCLAFGMLWLARRVICAWRQRRSDSEPETEPIPAELMDLELQEVESPAAPEPPAPEEQPKQRRKILARSETSGEFASEGSAKMDDVLQVIFPWGGSMEDSRAATRASGPSSALPTAVADSGVALLLADEPSQAGGWSPQAQWSLNRVPVRPPEEESVLAVESTLKEHAEDLQKQIAEFKQVAQNVQQATREQSAPLGDTLKDLAQQVSAIREYAASQQDRVEKLQDGYDWGIIRTFCLRVIRCIDNLEYRLDELPKDDRAVRHLEEIRDELLFALESSSVEQYRPEVNSEFHGQEKVAEALKEKQSAKKPEQAGRIARVVRPGYRYMMDDDNYRIVRTAQVKVYG